MDAVLEFPFTADLPAAEREDGQTRRERAERQVRVLRTMIEKKGVYMPIGIVSRVLDVSRQRVHDIVRQGHLDKVEFDGTTFITEASLIEYVNSERKAGRPPKVPTIKEMAVMAKDFASEV
jgi:hypothetical protein